MAFPWMKCWRSTITGTEFPKVSPTINQGRRQEQRVDPVGLRLLLTTVGLRGVLQSFHRQTGQVRTGPRSSAECCGSVPERRPMEAGSRTH